MIRNTLIFIGAGLLLTQLSAIAQPIVPGSGYYHDALDYSQNELLGTARMQAIGGAKVALGADMSSAAVNPAGLAFFNKSSITFSPGLYVLNSRATYLGSQSPDFKAPLGVASFGVVFNNEMEGPTGDWRGGNLAITHTRLNTYHERITYEGDLTGVNEYDDFVGYALNDLDQYGYDGATNLAALAYDTYVILGPDDGFDGFVTSVYAPTADLPTRQAEVIEVSGKKNLFNIAYSANYKDKLYIGGGVGIISTERSIVRAYEERPTPQDTMPLANLIIDDVLNQNGRGFNVNFGAIYRPVKFLMIGASYESPTFIGMSENWEQTMSSSFTSNYFVEDVAGTTQQYTYASDGDFEFEMITPQRFRGGVSVFLGKRGFVSADVEYVDYTQAAVTIDGVSTNQDNTNINTLYTSALNYSLGGEVREGNFYGRLGYAYRQDPVKNGISPVSRDVRYFTGGVGFRKDKVFVDLALVNGRTNSEWNRYAGGAYATVANREMRFISTIGFNF